MTKLLIMGAAEGLSISGALVAEAWPVALGCAVLVLGQAAVLRSAARMGRSWLAWRASRRLPIPGELWVGPTLGAVRIECVVVGDPVLWLMTLGASTEIIFDPTATTDRRRTTIRHWRAAGMAPVPHAEWDDYLKHGKVL